MADIPPVPDLPSSLHQYSSSGSDGHGSTVSVRSHDAYEDALGVGTNAGTSATAMTDRLHLAHSTENSPTPLPPTTGGLNKVRSGYLDQSPPAHVKTTRLKRSTSAQSNLEFGFGDAAGVAETEVADDTDTQSPSTAPRSVLSRSTKSYAVSSVSSVLPPPNSALPALQTRAATEHDGLEPLVEEEIDPASFDLVIPSHGATKQYSLETRSEVLFSTDHLQIIFEDPVLLQRFTSFVCASRPSSVPLLVYYLDALKAMKAINYVNAITRSLVPVEDLGFTKDSIAQTKNEALVQQAKQAFEVLAREDLAAYITHTWIQTVTVTIKRRIADTLPAHLRDLSEGLAEVFCLTDPSRPDNPIVFASEEFHKTTQYGMSYVLGRNCRFLQGPKTNKDSVRRIREKLEAGQEHCETFLNYRRDGSPFMNLLMVAPLYDSRGTIRYHIGAQVDVSGLVKEAAGLESFERLIERMEAEEALVNRKPKDAKDQSKDEFCELAEMFNLQELRTVRESGGNMHRMQQDDIQDTESVSNWNKPRLLIKDDASVHRRNSDPVLRLPTLSGGRLHGVYEHYLLVRPHPSLRILFASPSLRIPGILQSHMMARIGGSSRVREAIEQAFADGNGVTAKIRWISKADREGKGRWIHCTPLLGSNGAVGVWMVVLVDDEAEKALRHGRVAPPIETRVTSKTTDDDSMSLSSFAAANRVLDEQQSSREQSYASPRSNHQLRPPPTPAFESPDLNSSAPTTPHTVKLGSPWTGERSSFAATAL